MRCFRQVQQYVAKQGMKRETQGISKEVTVRRTFNSFGDWTGKAVAVFHWLLGTSRRISKRYQKMIVVVKQIDSLLDERFESFQ